MMSDTPRTDVAQHNMGSIMEPHYVVDADFSRYLERELVGARAELAEAQAEITRLKGEAQYGSTFVQRAIDAERELAEAKMEAERYRWLRDNSYNVQIGLERELAEANARLDWLDTVECGIQHKSYGEYRHYIGKGFPKAREIIDAAMKEGGK